MDTDWEKLVVFDPEAEWFDDPGQLPHWSQDGTMCWITMRLDDSLPRPVIEGWIAEVQQWLASWGIDPEKDVKQQIRKRSPDIRRQVLRRICNSWDDRLDDCHGSCVLRDPTLAKIVADSLLHFNGQRYWVASFVIMPNHLHLLASFASAALMKSQCKSWKHFTGTQINRALGRRGRCWKSEAFDHLVRSEDQFRHLLTYNEDNPKKAKLREGEYILYRSPHLTGHGG